MWGAGSCLVLWKVSDAVALGGRARGGWVRVLSRVPSSSCPARRSSGCIFARQGHRRCLYPRGPGTRPPGGWVRGRWGSSRVSVRWGHRCCLYPCGPGTHGSGEWSRSGAGSRVGVVGRVPSSLRVVRRGPAGPGGSGPPPFLVRPVGWNCRDPRRTGPVGSVGPVWPVGPAPCVCGLCG